MPFPALAAQVAYTPPEQLNDQDGNPVVVAGAAVAGLVTGDNGDGTWKLVIFPTNRTPETVDAAQPGDGPGGFIDATIAIKAKS